MPIPDHSPDPARIQADLEALVALESPTEDAARVTAAIAAVETRLAEAGAETTRIPGRDGFGDHLAATLAGGREGAPVLILCHLDTVHPVGAFGPAPVRIEGRRLIGPGSVDMKGGVALALALVRTLAADPAPRRPVRLLFTSDEEVGSPTSRALIEAEAAPASHVLVVEPAREGGGVVTGRRGVGRYVVRAHGRPSHSGLDHPAGRSAIRTLARAILEIEAMTDYTRNVALNVGTVRGGTGANVVPEHAEALVDLRIDDPADAEEFDARIRALASGDEGVTLTVEGGINRPPYRRSPGIDSLLALAREAGAPLGLALPDVHTGGGGDSSFVAAMTPVLDGLGVAGGGAHTLGEWVDLDSLAPRGALLARLTDRVARM
ncbi:M20 family metallopeptidase [Albimonas sp. CAU 1670]|uniref:M20 family metallopeptidase n=1 Tax=Albimonas sp. CAU 1670 TaxID=3032599 RepID=UPI0023DCB0DF|nr:M20 family metallopeptidase [Albimonas sp. CAU 1670]MDF2235294.1 M20 family metallopeptidase [Albimonas sp. CAU 1670]